MEKTTQQLFQQSSPITHFPDKMSSLITTKS